MIGVGAEVFGDVAEAEGTGEGGGSLSLSGMTIKDGANGAISGAGSDGLCFAFLDLRVEEMIYVIDGVDPKIGTCVWLGQVIWGDRVHCGLRN